MNPDQEVGQLETCKVIHDHVGVIRLDQAAVNREKFLLAISVSGNDNGN